MLQIMKCKVHGDTDFRNDGKNSTRFRCSKCLAESAKIRRQKLKREAVDYLGGKCLHCGYDRCIQALEFHHTDPSIKDFGLSDSLRWGKVEQLREELDKCILLCSNCHREEHYRLGF